VLAAIACLFAGPAQAARVHLLELNETLPNRETPYSVAVNQTTHHIYVVSADCCNHLRVHNFDAEGKPDPDQPELTGASTSNASNVAVDNSGGAHAGYIYVVNIPFTGAGNVQQFDPEGKATAVTITGAAIPANETPQAGGLPPVVNNGSFVPRAVAVDGSGNVLISDDSTGAIDVFKPEGSFVRQIAAGAVGFAGAIASDSSGHLYVAASRLGSGVVELDASTGECVQAGCAPIGPNPSRGVAVDNAAGIVYTSGTTSEQIGSEEGNFSEYDAATGDLLGVTHPETLHLPGSIAVDETSGKVVVSDHSLVSEPTLQIFGPLEIVPDVETLTPEEVTDRSVTLKGEIGAAEVNGTTCSFQYVDQAAFSAHGFEGAAEAPCEENGQPAGPFSGGEMHEVEAHPTGLHGGTRYHERILGKNDNGFNAGKDIPFETKGPTVRGAEVSEVGESEATLKAAVDPNGAATTYRFQYLTQAQFEAGGWVGASEVPAGGEALGSGNETIARSRRIEGLEPATEYRFRVLAISSGGESAGETKSEEIAFSTFAPPTVGLPDGRRYEQASPFGKNGTNVQGGIDSVQASLDGSRITFFANAGIPGGEGAQEFPTFLASRAADGSGWSTRGLLPPASYGPRATIVGWSEDLEDTYDFASKPFEGSKLLLRNSATAALSELGTIASPNNPFALAATSQGGAVALLESLAGGLLPGDLEGKQNVYAYDRETGALVVAGVMNDGSVPPGGAMAGPYSWFNNGSPIGTLGGALSGYYTQPIHSISADGSEAFFTAGGTGQLYVRLNPLAPQSATSGEECTEAAKACTVRISAPEDGVTDPGAPAAFLGASADGRFAYFLDKGRLTQDSTAGIGSDLYRYDVQSGNLTDLTPDSVDRKGARVEGMLGIGGPTGEDAYFVATGALAAHATQAPAEETNLYALHGTAIEFVTRLGSPPGGGGDADNWTPVSSKAGGLVTTRAARVGANGQTLLVSSQNKLTPYDSHGFTELYLYRSGRGISCISCNPTGEAPAGSAQVQGIPVVGVHLQRRSSLITRNLSADGQRVIFDSSDRLLVADRNTVNDVYEWEAKGKGSCESEAVAGGCLFLISGGAEGAGPSFFADADEEGKNVFFFTSQRLVAQDGDELVDVYDARVGGGIAAQEEMRQPPCEGEAGCRGAAPAPPEPPSPGSLSFAGSGNPKAQAPCPKGKVRKNGHCVAKHKQKKHKKHKHKNVKRPGRGK